MFNVEPRTLNVELLLLQRQLPKELVVRLGAVYLVAHVLPLGG